jgi:hypothetical protein
MSVVLEAAQTRYSTPIPGSGAGAPVHENRDLMISAQLLQSEHCIMTLANLEAWESPKTRIESPS